MPIIFFLLHRISRLLPDILNLLIVEVFDTLDQKTHRHPFALFPLKGKNRGSKRVIQFDSLNVRFERV